MTDRFQAAAANGVIIHWRRGEGAVCGYGLIGGAWSRFEERVTCAVCLNVGWHEAHNALLDARYETARADVA